MQIEECLGRILDRIQPSENTEYVQMEETICGRILAEDILAKRNVPAFPRSAMDGYAVHSEDVSDASREVPAVLKVQGELCAGDVPLNGADYGRGTAVRIMTGAYVPEAYDAVVMQENTDYGMEQVQIFSPVKAYQNYCKVGEDIGEGAVLAGKGTRITPAHMEKLKAEITGVLAEADFIITTGGVSVGKKDIVPRVLKEMGAEILFHGADIQPGTPTLGAYLDGTVILALSGNPYAAMANFELYFWEAMAKRMQSDSLKPKCKKAILKSEYTKVNKHRRLIRAYYEDGEVRLPSGVHASSVISNLTECNCFIDLEAGRAVNTGDTVRVRLYKYC